MTTTAVADPATRRRWARRPWRIAFAVYAAALEIATHWPRLQLGEGMPATDKTIHAIAFGVLAILLWRTGWIRPWWLAFLAAAIWSAVDEWSQAVPFVGRSASGHDLVANLCGVAVAFAWVLAARPVGGRTSRARQMLDRAALEALFARPRTWAVVAASCGTTGAALVAIVLLLPGIGPDERGLPTAAAVLLAAAVAALLLRRPLGREHAAIVDARACFACGRGCADVAFDATGGGACPSCGEPLRRDQWPAEPGGAGRVASRAAIAPALLVAAVVAGAFAALLLVPSLYGALIGGDSPWGPAAMRLVRRYAAMPTTLERVVDGTLVAILLAVAAAIYRRILARHHDRLVLCARCGHDLRGTPAAGGRLRCGECGHEVGVDEERS